MSFQENQSISPNVIGINIDVSQHAGRLALLGNEQAPADIATTIDQLEEENSPAWQQSRTQIMELSPEDVYADYGSTAVAWAASHADKQKTYKATLEKAGYDYTMFSKADRWTKEQADLSGTQPKLADLLSQYRLQETIMNGDANIDLAQVLKNSARPNVTIDDKRTKDYELIPSKVMGARPHGYVPELSLRSEQTGGYDYNIGMDTPTGYILTYKGIPNAILGVAAKGPNEVMIYQMQGVLGRQKDANNEIVATKKARGLAPLNWQKLLINVAETVADSVDATSLGIQEGAQNAWHTMTIRPDETVPHLTLEQAVQSYDVPAERNGFTKGADSNWHRPL